MAQNSPYTCHEYREEMLLLSLQRRLNADDVSDAEREHLKIQIAELETAMGMD